MNLSGSLAIAATLALSSLAVSPVLAQANWDLAVPPYSASSDQGRSIPRHAAQTTGVLALGGLPPLHQVSLPEGALEIRVWVVPLTIPHRLLRIVRTENGVVGEMFAWWSASDEVSPGWYQERLAGEYGCRESGAAQPTVSDGLVYNVLCRVSYDGAEPGWDWVLQSLDAAWVRKLSDRSDELYGFDGLMLSVDVLEAGRFHSFRYHNPGMHGDGEGKDAQRIVDLVDAIFPWVSPADWCYVGCG